MRFLISNISLSLHLEKSNDERFPISSLPCPKRHGLEAIEWVKSQDLIKQKL